MKQVTMYKSEISGRVYDTPEKALADDKKIPRAKINLLLRRIRKNVYWEPKVGDVIYVPTRLYIDHGEDDVEGGLAMVTEIKDNYGTRFFYTAQHPGSGYNWKILYEDQAKHQKRYGMQVAYPDPDC